MKLTKYAITLSIGAGLFMQSGFAHNLGTLVTVTREAQPGDDHRGKGKPVMFAREAQPGDDRGGKGQPQPGDDRGRGKGKPNA